MSTETFGADKAQITETTAGSITGMIDAGQMLQNPITHFANDHPIYTDDPDSEKQIIYDHDYILEVDPAKDVEVKAGKEAYDSAKRQAIANAMNPESEPEESEEPTDPEEPIN